ncbi:zinc-binding dehydrogenase [Antarcticibacterium flavum]|uniref:Zinc-binding dehydrogenase n=1 Tax=Antarcticibacterium flavum TaxID=2058175 RepID=A0A5B7X194_9FLAO|nr:MULTISPECIES: zinc-binding dehydrogenase [Antarcticibacterium]MCM4161446.1 L-iditol 2-dehydrogenase [Antarcticibacterium sp. W02-3]QCY69316.1 zinc-binding dehydrogenase [Antarcticibacterium flavum]
MPPVQNKDDYRAAVITAPGEVKIKESHLPEPKEDEVRIKIEGCGICASNIPVWEGRDWFEYPIPAGNPGHEAWGIVDKVGSNAKNFTPGERVTGLSYNAYATHDIAKASDLVVLPDFLDNKPFPGEPLGCAMNIFSRSDIQKGQTIAVVGSGFLGLLLIQLAKSAGARVIAISRRDFSLEMAKKAGADECITMDDHYQIIEKVKQITEGKFCERVIEATGKEWPLNLSIELTAEKGKLIVAGFHQDGMRSVNVQMLNWRGIDMINAHEREPEKYVEGIKAAIDAIQKQEMDPFPFFTHGYSLEEMDAAYKDLTERQDGFIKGVIINKQ